MNTTDNPQPVERGATQCERCQANRRREIVGAARKLMWAILVIWATLVLYTGCAAPVSTAPKGITPQQQVEIEEAKRGVESARREKSKIRLERERIVAAARDERWQKLRRMILGAKLGRKVDL